MRVRMHNKHSGETMPTNLSLILNLLFLAGVVATIVRVVRQRHANTEKKIESAAPKLEPSVTAKNDDIISVRKIQVDDSVAAATEKPAASLVKNTPQRAPAMQSITEADPAPVNDPVVLFLAAKKNQQFAGYELLQALLASGLRYGDGNLFHRYQRENGQGTVMCSLAAATQTGQFNLSRMGAFTCKGLCLYLEPSHNSNIDNERFTVMYEIATQLAEGLDATLLDEQHKPFNSRSISHYEKRLGCSLELEPSEA